MPHVRAGAASIHDPRQSRAEDRVLIGEHAWAILSGTINAVDGENEADVVVGIAEELVGAGTPSLDAVQASLLAMDRAVAQWAARAGTADDLAAPGLAAIVLVVFGDVAQLAHVGASRAYRLLQSEVDDPLVADALTIDHSLAERMRLAASRAGAPLDEATIRETKAEEVSTSALGTGRVPRIDFARIALGRRSRIVLVSPGARRGLDTPLGYLRQLRAPAEVAQRICAESRSRAGHRPHHASAIVVDVEPESITGPYR